MVIPGSKIHIDEHKSYQILYKIGYDHSTNCQKFVFVNKLTGTNAQAAEFPNNYFKYHKRAKKPFIKERLPLYWRSGRDSNPRPHA